MSAGGDRDAQLPLFLPLGEARGAEDFIVGASNNAAFRLVNQWPHWPSRVIFLSGPRGCGKTHLAHIWCMKSGAKIHDLAQFAVGSIDRMAMERALVLENAHCLFNEAALCHLLNLARERGLWLLMTSRLALSGLDVSLGDLRSRLRAATPVAVDLPDDDLLRRVMTKQFGDRQMTIDEDVMRFLLIRMERSFSFAMDLIAALDRATLARKRRLTRPFAAQILAQLEASRRLGANMMTGADDTLP